MSNRNDNQKDSNSNEDLMKPFTSDKSAKADQEANNKADQDSDKKSDKHVEEQPDHKQDQGKPKVASADNASSYNNNKNSSENDSADDRGEMDDTIISGTPLVNAESNKPEADAGGQVESEGKADSENDDDDTGQEETIVSSRGFGLGAVGTQKLADEIVPPEAAPRVGNEHGEAARNAAVVESDDEEISKHEGSASGDGKKRKDRKKKQKSGRIRLIPIWFRLILILFFISVALVLGAMMGYAILGEGGNPMDVLEPETWYHIYDLIFDGTEMERQR